MTKNSNLLALVVDYKSTLKNALKITNRPEGTCFILKDEFLVGVLTDGDIRRAMVAGHPIDTAVSSVMNTKFVSCLYNDDYFKILKDKPVSVRYIPLVDANGRLMDFISRSTLEKKIALITGITGQDGAYLAQFLLKKGYRVYGAYRINSTPNFEKIDELGITQKIDLIDFDLIDMGSIINAIETIQPHEIYNLAAQSFVKHSFSQPVGTSHMTALGATNVLEAIRLTSIGSKFYQASSSEMFGKVQQIPQNELTPFYPRSPYAVAKLYAHYMTINYRESYGIFACSGILFNHESPLRGLEFVTRKITNTAAKIKLGLANELQLGNLEAKRDWGYAPDYVECMWLMLQQDKPDDYVIATGETHSVKEFVEKTFSYLDLDYKKYVKINPKYYRPTEVDILLGDPSKAKGKLNWNPTKTTFDELIEIMIKSDLKRLEK